MAPTSNHDEGLNDSLGTIQREVTHLRETISAMRDQLETMRFERDAAVQQAVKAGSDEIEQLRATVQALRDQLEVSRLDADAKLHARERLLRDEIDQLHATIASLRNRLEEAHGRNS